MVCFALTKSSWTQQEFLHFRKISFNKKYLWEQFATGKTESAILWENGMLKVRLFQFALAMNNASDNHMRVLLFWRCWRLIMGLCQPTPRNYVTNETELSENNQIISQICKNRWEIKWAKTDHWITKPLLFKYRRYKNWLATMELPDRSGVYENRCVKLKYTFGFIERMLHI